jgi:cold shock CspA family protein
MNGLSGVVINYSDSRRWGFIAGDDGQRYSAHRDEVIGRLPLQHGERVGFDYLPDAQGPRTLGIVRLPTSTSAEEA